MVVAMTALCVAASGTAIAASKLVRGDKLIAKTSLSGNRLRHHTITGTQVNLNKLGKVPSAKNADNATNAKTATTATSALNATNATNANHSTSAASAASATVSRFDYESSAPTALSPTNTNVSQSVNCPSGLDAVGGGTKVSDPGPAFINDSAPLGRTGWQGDAQSSVTGNTMTVYVICAPAVTTTP